MLGLYLGMGILLQAGAFELVAAVRDSPGSAVRQRGACTAAAPVTAKCALDAADLQRRWSAGQTARVRVLMADACAAASENSLPCLAHSASSCQALPRHEVSTLNIKLLRPARAAPGRSMLLLSKGEELLEGERVESTRHGTGSATA